MYNPYFHAISNATPGEKEALTTKRGSDILTVVEVADNSTVTASKISEDAAQQQDVPHYKSDGAGAILVFHTESGVYVLGGVRNNPALDKELTKENTPFPQQINSTIGGFLADPQLSLRDGVISAIKNKMFLQVELAKDAEGFAAQQVLKELCSIIENNDGWEPKVCVHTDCWTNNDNTKGTMCYLTAIKHISCRDSDLLKINEALQTTMFIKKKENVNPRALSEFKFVTLEPVIANSLATHLDDEITKARKAYEQFGNLVAVTFNDLAVATLAKNGAFQPNLMAQLNSLNNTIKNTV